ncbi:MAG: FAD-dependent oxidoreductase, partial [Planctomycetes bacterium]|nr:FAD-dependent oxidoreductase [Planctomycetota bacterium]
MAQIRVPEHSVPVHSKCDVLVCGGGCAGVSAAVSAARHGAEVILLERWPSVGGLATNGLVNGWHRSDREKMVIYGLVEESAQRADKGGWIRQDEK